MQTLLLMRHAKSSWDQPALPDHLRPLNLRGLRTAPLMARFLASKEIRPDLIVSSPALRADHTAHLVAEELQAPVTVVDELYLATVDIWTHVLEQFSSSECVLMVGHNPGIEEFVTKIAGGYEWIPTAAIARFSVDSETEGSIVDRLKLKKIWRPKELNLKQFK